MARKCIFCGHEGGLTREHAWPNWIAEDVLPHLNEAAPRMRVTRKRDTGELYDRRDTNENPLAKKIQQVCGPCNHGWMSRLEIKAKPILTPMLLGHHTTLSVEDQATVAFWASKTACVLEYTQPARQRGIPQEHRTYLYEKEQAPPTVGVWLAYYAYLGRKAPFYYQANVWLREGEESPRTGPPTTPPNAYTAAFGVEHLPIQVFGHVVPAATDFRGGDLVIGIWPDPASDVRWPPARSIFTPDDLTRFCEDVTGL